MPVAGGIGSGERVSCLKPIHYVNERRLLGGFHGEAFHRDVKLGEDVGAHEPSDRFPPASIA